MCPVRQDPEVPRHHQTQSPVELFDALVAAFHNLVDGRIWTRWLVFELRVERYRIMLTFLELVGLIAEQAEDNLLAGTRDKNATKRIGNVRCVLYNKLRPNGDCMPPIQLRSSEGLQPVFAVAAGTPGVRSGQTSYASLQVRKLVTSHEFHLKREDDLKLLER
jgi:hypothetical protein